MPIGSETLFKVKKVIAGQYEAPMVIADELRVMNGAGKFVVGETLKAYTQDGKDSPRVAVEVKAGEDIRVPSFVVRRAKDKGIEFHPKQVYWAKHIEDKALSGGKTFKVAAVALVGTEFPTE